MFWCAIWKIQPVHFVQFILNNPCAICDRIPYTLSCYFYFRNLSLYCTFIWFILCSLSILISESIYVLSSHVHPQCHQFIVVLCLAWLFLDFGNFCLNWNCCDFDLLVPFIFSLSSYLCLDLHKFHFTYSIVFVFWYLAVFCFQFFQNPLFYILCGGCFVWENYFHS